MSLSPNKILLKILSDRLGRSANKLELRPRIATFGRELPELSESEKISIQNIWGSISGGTLNLDYWKYYKAMGVNDSRLVPDNIYWSRIIRALNPVSLTRTYINKSLYPIIFNGIRQPRILVNVINGIPYNDKMDRISFNEAATILCDFNDDIIIKRTTSTSGGQGVKKIPSDTQPENIRQILSSYGKNYICQGVVRQSADTAAFNASSLNTFRVNTLNINGKTTCECLMMRHGLGNNFVDNFASGGICCGMSKDGNYNGNNYNTGLQKVSHLPNGTDYSTLGVPSISDVIAEAVDTHQRYMPHIGHAAWDFALDENNRPVMIEVNLMLPGIMMEQLTSTGSIFGDRTEEVIQYAAKRNNGLKWSEFVGGWE